MSILPSTRIWDVLTSAWSCSLRGPVCGVTPLSLATAVFASFVILGCATPGSDFRRFHKPPMGAFNCSPGHCTVQVSLDCSANPCTITIPNAQEIVAANGNDIVWELAPGTPASYLFKQSGGIFLKTPEGQHAFHCQSLPGDTKFRCSGTKDRNAYEYGIEIVGPTRVTILDPWIVND